MEDILNNLNTFLSDLNVFYRKLQNYHWNIKGKDFFTIHAKLEEYYDEVNKSIDEVAENLLMMGGKPVGSLKKMMELSVIEEAEDESIKSKHIFKEVLKDFSYLLGLVKEIKVLADEESNYLISALMDEYIKQFSKSIWMINQVVED